MYPFCLLYARPNWLHRQKKYDKMGAHSKNTGQKHLPVGINAESWTENMGISHEYHSAPRRRTRGGIGGKLRLAGVIVAILLVAYAVTAILEKGTVEEDSTPQTGAGGIAQNILAPLPMQGEAASGSGSESTADSSGTAQAVQLESFGPARQTDGAYTIKAYDASVIRQPTCGQVDLSYFSDAAFLGDSLTVGFSDYQINLSGALICGYTGVGPDAIVNRAAVKSPTRGQEVALDVLAAAQPKKLYILLGTNTLTTLGASDRFLAYYGQMLDELRQLEQLEIVEEVEANAAGVICERDLQDPNRLDCRIPSDVVNGLHVFAGVIDLRL